jgi:hypothetical protein
MLCILLTLHRFHASRPANISMTTRSLSNGRAPTNICAHICCYTFTVGCCGQGRWVDSNNRWWTHNLRMLIAAPTPAPMRLEPIGQCLWGVWVCVRPEDTTPSVCGGLSHHVASYPPLGTLCQRCCRPMLMQFHYAQTRTPRHTGRREDSAHIWVGI